jgi:hypothetical protein
MSASDCVSEGWRRRIIPAAADEVNQGENVRPIDLSYPGWTARTERANTKKIELPS